MEGFTQQFNQRLRDNLNALTQRQPNLAKQLESIDDFDTARVVCGRDYHDVILLQQQDGVSHWLGGSSMPTVSGPAVIEGYVHFNDSVILPSIGTGYEPAMLARRLASQCAVFVFEQDPQRLALGLGVFDDASLIANGRVVFLTGDLADSLADFFETNSGYCLPAHLWPLSEVPAARLDRIAHAMRLAIARVNRIQNQQMSQVSARLAASSVSDAGQVKRLWIASRDFGPQAAEHADRMVRAAEALGYQVCACMPNDPTRASETARMESAANFNPDIAIWINSCPADMSRHMARTKHAAWYLESASLPAVALTGLSECESIFVASKTIRPLIESHGANPGCVQVMEIGVDSELFTAADDAVRSHENEVLILAEGCDVSPTAAGVGLESHCRIWNRFCKLLDDEPDSFGPSDLDPWLSRCEKMTGSPLADEKLRRDFAALIAPRLPATLIARATVLVLQKAGIDVRLLGSGWDTFEEMKGLCSGPIPPADQRIDAYQRATLVVAPWWDGQSVQFAQEAMAAGCVAILRKPDSQRLEAYPQSGDLLADFPTFADRAELVKICRQLLSDTARRSAIMANFRDRFLETHSTKSRLESLISGLPSRPAERAVAAPMG